MNNGALVALHGKASISSALIIGHDRLKLSDATKPCPRRFINTWDGKSLGRGEILPNGKLVTSH